ncbi:MAG: hypothetical protein JWR55_955 [Aeromicrobium sp.]|nr:hypothetical protein [Aeromicrobium sp.]
MVAHRKNVPPRQGYVPSSWFIVLTVLVVIGSAGWLGWLLLDDDGAAEASPAEAPATSAAPATSSTPAAEPTTAEPTTSEPTTAEPTTAEPTPEPTKTTSEPEPEVTRDSPVSVLNNTGVTGAARVFSGRVAAAGWRLGGVGNWSGSIPANTVYYPAGLQEQAQLLADDVGIARVVPSVAPMRMDRLTIILSGPQ